jgi:hypothetical protein
MHDGACFVRVPDDRQDVSRKTISLGLHGPAQAFQSIWTAAHRCTGCCQPSTSPPKALPNLSGCEMMVPTTRGRGNASPANRSRGRGLGRSWAA